MFLKRLVPKKGEELPSELENLKIRNNASDSDTLNLDVSFS